ncbi:MAG: alpha-amylase [Bacteroidales bacterium]|nr:alpha-amylase [Bacteroidales bacterium]
MKTICLNFNLHKSLLLKRYRFFDIGKDNFYFDDYATRAEIERNEREFLRPSLEALLALVRHHDTDFRFSLTISGIFLNLIEKCCPATLEIIQQLADTGCVEFVGMPYNHSLTSITDEDEFVRQVMKHSSEIERLFDTKPTTFRNTELIYTDQIGEIVYGLGFKTILVEGAGRSLDIKGPDFVYFNPLQPRLRILPRNESISRMLEDALKDKKLFTPVYFAERLYEIDEYDDMIYMGLNFEYFDSTRYHNNEVLMFIKNLSEKIIGSGVYRFQTPGETAYEYQPVGPFKSVTPLSGMNRYHDMTPWQGNELQQEALEKIASLQHSVKVANHKVLKEIWENLQCSDYFYYMSTEYFNNPTYGYKPNPFKSPYEAFINYMNILGDLERRLNEKIKQDEADSMTDEQIKDVISFYEKEISLLKQKLSK